MKRLLSPLVVLWMVLAGGARAADVEGRLRVTGRMMADGNAPRDFTQGRTRVDTSDLVFGLLASGEGRYTAERWQLVGRYDGGVRKYVAFSSQDTLVQSAALEGSVALGGALGLGLEGRGKHRLGGARAYTDLGATAFLEYAPDARLGLRLRVGAHRFLYAPDFSASFGGPEVGFLARYRLDRRHALSAVGEYGGRRFSSSVRYPPGSTPTWTVRRQDTALLANVGYTYKGPVSLGLAYTYLETSSNSYGESVQRHRLTGSAGVRLPFKMTLMAQGTLGVNRFTDGVYLSPDIILIEDDEAQNSLSLRLARPLHPKLDLELSYAVYGTQLPGNGLSYFRQVGGVGVTWRP